MTLRFILIAAAVPVILMGAHRHTVAIAGFQFSPLVMRASVGDTVVWENRDIVPHTATADDGSWDSGPIPAKSKVTMILRSAGEQPFTCIYHANMKGKLIVK